MKTFYIGSMIEELKEQLGKRKHLFRSWSVQDKKMYYDVIVTPDGWVYREEGRKEIGMGDNGVDCFVMECIGIEDENKKEIFKCDIVKWHDGMGDVYYKRGEYLVTDFYAQSQDSPCSPFSEYCRFEIIGNCFENPDLLPKDS